MTPNQLALLVAGVLSTIWLLVRAAREPAPENAGGADEPPTP